MLGVEGVSAIFHPWPAGFAGTPEEIILQVERYPAWELALLGSVGWGGTMLICVFIATRMGHNCNPLHGYGVGLILLVMVVFNLSMLPYPVWFWAMNLTILPAAVYFGTGFSIKINKGPE
ncbi:MAG: hypothetical protein CMQ41_14555 [Gammaproteobacteria bacterium]|nr:hypothetical protein [Gammaproteobacteria bacterium]